jgi:Tol biopolymer transport system component
VLIALGLAVNRAVGGSSGNGWSSSTPAPTGSNVAPVGQTFDSGGLHIQVQPVAPAAEDQRPQRAVVSPDGLHIAFVSIRGSRFVLVVDGKPSTKYDEIGRTNTANDRPITFSADGQHVMFTARKGEDHLVVIDGQELSGYQLVEQCTFSPDAKQYAFVAQHDQLNAHRLAVVNGKDSQNYVTITDMQFSPNGSHVAYIGTVVDRSKPANTSVVMDGKSETLFYKVHDFCFSADGNHWAYIGEDFTGNVAPGTHVQKAHLMVDGKELAAFEDIYNCQLSADGHVAYCANKLTHIGAQSETIQDQCVGLDAQVWDLPKDHRFPGSSGGTAQPACLSPDGQHVAWLEEHPGNNEQCVSVNGKRGLGYHQIQNITFSPDSQHIVYVATQPDNGTYVVRDEDEAGPYKRAPNAGGLQFRLYFSPDGKHLAYQAGDGQMTFVVEDGKQQTSYAAIHGPLAFSHDGRLAYIAAKDTMSNLAPLAYQQAQQSATFDHGRYIVVDGQQQPLFATVGFQEYGPHFSPDGTHLAYTDDGTQMVVDGRLVKTSRKPQAGFAGVDLTFAFTADSKHVLCQVVVGHFLIDGDEVTGYSLFSGVPSYKPLLQPDGSVFFFATKDGGGPGVYRVTVNPGSPRDFGATASTGDTTANNPNPQQDTKPPDNQAQPQNPQSPNDAQTASDKAAADAQKAKNAAGKLRGFFGH